MKASETPYMKKGNKHGIYFHSLFIGAGTSQNLYKDYAFCLRDCVLHAILK
jgi:hypothetical protein